MDLKPAKSIVTLVVVGPVSPALFTPHWFKVNELVREGEADEAKIQLTVVTDEAVKLETQLAELELAQNRLLIDYESVFNRTEIEEYATTVLGMQRPREEQITYLNTSVPDKAVVLEHASDTNSLTARLSDMFGFLGEYFK